MRNKIIKDIAICQRLRLCYSTLSPVQNNPRRPHSSPPPPTQPPRKHNAPSRAPKACDGIVATWTLLFIYNVIVLKIELSQRNCSGFIRTASPWQTTSSGGVGALKRQLCREYPLKVAWGRRRNIFLYTEAADRFGDELCQVISDSCRTILHPELMRLLNHVTGFFGAPVTGTLIYWWITSFVNRPFWIARLVMTSIPYI